jgi:hypothetical protein
MAAVETPELLRAQTKIDGVWVDLPLTDVRTEEDKQLLVLRAHNQICCIFRGTYTTGGGKVERDIESGTFSFKLSRRDQKSLRFVSAGTLSKPKRPREEEPGDENRQETRPRVDSLEQGVPAAGTVDALLKASASVEAPGDPSEVDLDAVFGADEYAFEKKDYDLSSHDIDTNACGPLLTA